MVQESLCGATLQCVAPTEMHGPAWVVVWVVLLPVSLVLLAQHVLPRLWCDGARVVCQPLVGFWFVRCSCVVVRADW